MDRSRSSKRGYHYNNDQDSPPPRSKPRFDRRGEGGGPNPNANNNYHRRGPPGGGGGGPDRRGNFLPPDAGPPPPPSNSAPAVAGGPSLTTAFRIICPESKTYGFAANFIANAQDDSGAIITLHAPFAGDPVRVIETADGAPRESDGRPPMFSPAQEALLMVHRRILETQPDDGDEDGEYGPRGKDARDRGKVTTRLVVPRQHVGCLLGKGGKTARSSSR